MGLHREAAVVVPQATLRSESSVPHISAGPKQTEINPSIWKIHFSFPTILNFLPQAGLNQVQKHPVLEQGHLQSRQRLQALAGF